MGQGPSASRCQGAAHRFLKALAYPEHHPHLSTLGENSCGTCVKKDNLGFIEGIQR